MSVLVEPLTMLRPDGRPYERLPHVETQLGRMLLLPQPERLAEMPDAYSETVAYFIRRRKHADEQLFEVVFREVCKRITGAGRRHVRGLPKIAAQEIVDKVEIQILELLVKNSADPAGDFFEVGFAQGVEGRTRNAKRGYKRSTMGGRRGWIVTDETDEEGDEIERPIELVADDAPGPDDMTIAIKNEELRRELFEGVKPRVKPMYLEAAILFYVENWPIRSKDPDTASLERRYGLTESQIRYRIDVVEKAMRAWLVERAEARRACAAKGNML